MSNPPRILVVEDEPALRQIMVTRLEGDGYEVECAVDGKEGLEKARKDSPDFILLDLMLPKIDGLKVCRLLKYDQQYRAIPIVIISARAGREDEQAAKSAGADTFFAKPLPWDKLTVEIKRLLGQRPKSN